MNNKFTAIICEYNPFHNGHLYQIEEARKSSDTIICIMSGNTVQRGGFACADKYERAKIAVQCGADLVVEHPFPYCMSSAADFASSGVFIAYALGVNSLAFGHESESSILVDIADTLMIKSSFDEINSIFKEDKSNKNLSFPKAREIYLSRILGEDYSRHMKLPNNILSVEYLLNINKYNSIKPTFIKRNFEFISAGEIRKKIFNNSDYSLFVPLAPNNVFDSEITDKMILAKLCFSKEYKDIYDCDFSLYNRIISNAKKSTSVDELVKRCTTSAYTSSKIRRTVYSIFFDVETKDVKKEPEFTVLLATNNNGLEYISKNKKRFEIPILTRSTDEKKHNINTSLALKPDRIFDLFSNIRYTPYKQPYINLNTKI